MPGFHERKPMKRLIRLAALQARHRCARVAGSALAAYSQIVVKNPSEVAGAAAR